MGLGDIATGAAAAAAGSTAEDLFPPRVTRRGVSLEGMDQETSEHISRIPDIRDRTAAAGVAGDRMYEPVPSYIKTPSEQVFKNDNNAWIVLGRDRHGPRSSGYGGRGETQCASVDIVAGRMGADPRQVNEDGELLHANPDFKLDAARIYMSQKTDIDSYFGLAPGIVGTSRTKSGIAVKADAVRIISRDGIKLVTRTDTRNSQGGQVHSISGIDLIAGNDDADLQPMVKGESLITALDALVSHVDRLNGIVDTFLMSQMEFNSFTTSHFHTSPFGGAPTTPSLTLIPAGISVAIKQLSQTKLSLLAHKANLALYKIRYLNQASGRYINSRYNNTN